jgi:hypothetical protein
VRSFFFFWGDEKPKKVRDSQDPEIPTELGFQKVRYPARNGEPRNSSDGHRRLRENPENRCDPQKKRWDEEGEEKKMSRDEKVKGIYGVDVLKKG